MTAAADEKAALDEAARAAAAALAPPVAVGDAAAALAPPAPPVQPSTAEMLAPLLGAAFRLLVPAWGVEEVESRELAAAWAAVLDKYFPGGVPIGVEVNALIVTLAVFGPRWDKPRRLAPPKSSSTAPAADGDGGKGAPLVPVGGDG